MNHTRKLPQSPNYYIKANNELVTDILNEMQIVSKTVKDQLFSDRAKVKKLA